MSLDPHTPKSKDPRPSDSMRKYAILAAGLAIGAAGLAMVLAPSLYEVVDKGRDLRPYESGPVYEIKVADTATVYASAESQPDTDAISGSAMAALAAVALMTSLLLGAANGSARIRRFYAFASAGFAFLAFDEFFAVHETIGHNLLVLSDLPGVERPDDVIFALYLVPAVAFLYVFRDVILASRRAIRFFVAALALFVVAGASDIAGIAADEPLEVLSAACIVGGFVTLMVGHLSSGLGLEGAQDPAGSPASSPTPPATASPV
jgi:hypothetical protein